MITPSPALTRYHHTARALGAKSALPLVAGTAALLAPSASAQAVAYVPTAHNVATAGDTFSGVGLAFASGQVSDASSFDADLGIINLRVPGDSSFDSYASVILFAQDGSVPRGVIKLDPVHTLSDGTSSYIQNFAGGIDVQSIFSADSSYAYGGLINGNYSDAAPAWVNATGYAALAFFHGGNTYFGWLKLHVNESTSEITLLAFGYNQTPGASLLTGEGTVQSVPEPATSAALLALGAAGLVAYRKRKQLQRAA